ncbi:MAG: DUF1573 domain-containing protein [Lachnospiraceae bacterium]|nr:DUF1573 domain-containing protein [Lachnospiraceae bacterium]
MMNILRVLPALALAVSALSANGATSAKWLETSHDFGAFDEDMGRVSTDFRLVNTGNEPLMIYAARASCGCTIPSYTKEPIAPGDTAVIKVVYDPAGRPGKFDKKVKVETNSDPRQTILVIKGVVIGASNTLRARFPIEVGKLKLRRDIVPVGEILKGRTKTAFLEGYNQSSDTIRPSIEGLPKYITVQTEPQCVPPGEQVTFTLFYNTAGENDWGLATHEAKINSDSRGGASHDINVTAIVNEDFSKMTKAELEKAPKIALSETRIDFGTIKKGEKKSGEINIDNFGKNELIIRKISSSDPCVSVKASKTKIKGGGNAVIKINADTSKSNDKMLNARITIITNDPDRPVSNIRVTGEY